jgi:hypothetical protein
VLAKHYRSNYSVIHLASKHGTLNNSYHLLSARISMATAISHAENENFAWKNCCQEELRTLIAA